MASSLDLKPLDQISEADLVGLITNAALESKVIDYKSALHGVTDGQRKEFLRDVCSFANASGGHLVFGITESRGIPVELCGLGPIDPEQEVNRLEGQAKAGIRPTILGIHAKAIPISGRGFAIILRIPRSLNAPHQVTFNDDMRFFARGSSGRYPMDVEEVRKHMEGTDTITGKLRNARVECVSRLRAGEGIVRSDGAAFLLVQLLPLASFTGDLVLPLDLNGGYWPCKPPNMRYGSNHKFCFEGFLFHSRDSRRGLNTEDYYLIHRSGIIESAELFEERWQGTPPSLGNIAFEQSIHRQIRNALLIAQELGIPAPGFITLALSGMRGWTLGVDVSMDTVSSPFSRDLYLPPEQYIEGMDVDPTTILKPLVDPIWNEAGFESSPNFEGTRWLLAR
jgi:hypothetical protein